MKIVFNLFLVQRLTAWLFQGRHLIGRLEWRHVILNLAANSFHCRSRTPSYMTNKLSITVLDESRDFNENKTTKNLLSKTTVPSGSPRKPASCNSVVWIKRWTLNEKIGSKWVQTWYARLLNIWILRRRWTKCRHATHYKKLGKTGNRA